ncbi:MinD/ParA family protein [Kitasatospora sp. NPDC050463]|uniref:MinD/ParA family ATP-binding protein n=1 Tax=Kitasatospora sp. NPDC050463 TaxID=3155786 RepID=UPI0033E962E6
MTAAPDTAYRSAPAAALDAFGTVLLPRLAPAPPPATTPAPVAAGRPATAPAGPAVAPAAPPVTATAVPPLPSTPPPLAPLPALPTAAIPPVAIPTATPPATAAAPRPGAEQRRNVLDVLRTGERRGREQLRRIRSPLHGSCRIAVISAKGGVGKTSLVLALGAMLATERGEPVAAVDVGTHPNSPARRIRPAAPAGTAELAAALRDGGPAGVDPGSYLAPTPTGLAVLAGPPYPGAGRPLDEADYRAVLSVLAERYPLTLTDCGTGLLDGPMRGVLDLADQLILATTPSVDGAGSAAATLDWLHAHGYGQLAERSVTAISAVRGAGRLVNSADLRAYFGTRCRGVVELPFDEHLAAGAEFEPGRLGHRTRRAVRELAALIGDDLWRAGRPTGW